MQFSTTMEFLRLIRAVQLLCGYSKLSGLRTTLHSRQLHRLPLVVSTPPDTNGLGIPCVDQAFLPQKLSLVFGDAAARLKDLHQGLEFGTSSRLHVRNTILLAYIRVDGDLDT
jgi:hypothetical protein